MAKIALSLQRTTKVAAAMASDIVIILTLEVKVMSQSLEYNAIVATVLTCFGAQFIRGFNRPIGHRVYLYMRACMQSSYICRYTEQLCGINKVNEASLDSYFSCTTLCDIL